MDETAKMKERRRLLADKISAAKMKEQRRLLADKISALEDQVKVFGTFSYKEDDDFTDSFLDYCIEKTKNTQSQLKKMKSQNRKVSVNS